MSIVLSQKALKKWEEVNKANTFELLIFIVNDLKEEFKRNQKMQALLTTAIAKMKEQGADFDRPTQNIDIEKFFSESFQKRIFKCRVALLPIFREIYSIKAN